MMRVIQIGYGYWGANIARKLVESPAFELVALCELKPELREKARAALPDTVAVNNNYTQYIDRADIDGFVIATQTEVSFAYAMEAWTPENMYLSRSPSRQRRSAPGG